MKSIGKFGLAFALCLSAASGPATAHHSFAMFDQNKLVELDDVTVVRFAWANPHVFVIVSSGGTTYMLECGSPSNMTGMGWKHRTLTVGEKIDVVFYPLRNGRPGGALKLATLANGQKLEAW